MGNYANICHGQVIRKKIYTKIDKKFQVLEISKIQKHLENIYLHQIPDLSKNYSKELSLLIINRVCVIEFSFF